MIPTAPTPPQGKLRVYLVDDEPMVLSALRRSLRNAPVEITTFESAKQALEATRRAPPDVIVADCQMPEVTGTELLEAVRQSGPFVRRVLLSASALFLSPEVSSSADLVLLKPWTERSIRLAIGLPDGL